MTIYTQIAQQLREEIKAFYRAGENLPSENTLANYFQVNRHTVRRAIDELVKEGLVIRLQGVGNQVRQPRINYMLHKGIQSVDNQYRDNEPLVLKNQVLFCREQPLTEQLAKQFDANEISSSNIVVLKTRYSIDHQMVQVTLHYLFDVAKSAISHYQKGSLHTFLWQRYHHTLSPQNRHFKIRMPTYDECKSLNISRLLPIVEMHTQHHQVDNGVLGEYTICIIRSDLFEFCLEPY